MNTGLLAVARTVIPERLHFSIFCPAFLLERVLKHTRGRVVTGPFPGLRYLETSFASVLIPKLPGIYERELHSVIEEILGLGFGKIVDIGAVEGCYAVGFASRLLQKGVGI